MKKQFLLFAVLFMGGAEAQHFDLCEAAKDRPACLVNAISIGDQYTAYSTNERAVAESTLRAAHPNDAETRSLAHAVWQKGWNRPLPNPLTDLVWVASYDYLFESHLHAKPLPPLNIQVEYVLDVLGK